MKTAIVIGVGPDRGLGAQLCKRFAAEGLKVIVAGRTLSALQAVADDIATAGGAAVPFVADATKEGDIAALFDAAGESLDLAVYNAGNNTPGKSSRWKPTISRRPGAWSASEGSCSAARRCAAWRRRRLAR